MIVSGLWFFHISAAYTFTSFVNYSYYFPYFLFKFLFVVTACFKFIKNNFLLFFPLLVFFLFSQLSIMLKNGFNSMISAFFCLLTIFLEKPGRCKLNLTVWASRHY